MKVLIFLSGYFLATLAQSVIVLNDINNIPICATFNNVNKTFINIWQIYDEFKTTGQIWTPVTTGACPQNNIDCTVLNPVCAVSSNNFFKTFPNRCVLENEQKTTGTVWNVVFNGICFVNQDDTYPTSPMLAKIYPATSPVSSDYKKVVPPPVLREPLKQYSTPSYGAVPSPSAVHYNPATQKLHSPQYPPPLNGPNNNNIPVNYNPAPTSQPYAPSLIPENYNQSVVQVPDVQAPFTLYSPAAIDTSKVSKVYNSTPEPSIYTVPSSNSDNNYQAPALLHSPSYLAPLTFAAPYPVPVIADPLPVPDEYSPSPAPQTYSSIVKIPSCHESLPLPSYPTYLLPPGNYSKSVEEVKAPLSLYSSPTIDTVPSHVTEVHHYSPEPLPPTTYTVPSPNSDISSSYLSHSNYTLLSPDDVTTKVNPLHAALVYNTAPTPQTYGPAIEIPSSDYNPSPVLGHYNPEPLPSPSYPGPSHIPENSNQPDKQFPEVQASLSLFSSPSIDTVSKPIHKVYNSPPEPLPPAINTAPLPISDSYYQAPAPVLSPSYLSPSNYTLLSPDPVPTIVDPLPVPVDYNTASTPQPYAPAIKILSCDHIASPVPGSYNPEPLHSSTYPAPSLVPGHYNQPVVQVPEEQAPLSLYSSPSINSVPTPLTNVYNSSPDLPPATTFTVASPISDSYYHAPEPVPSPSYLSPSNYTLLSPVPVPLPAPVSYSTAPTPQSYAPANEIPSSGYNSSPVPGPYNPEPLQSLSYPAPSPIPGNYDQPAVQVPKAQASSPLYSSPSIDTVSTPATDIYNIPPEPLPSAINTVPSPISDSYYQAPAPVPSPSYLSPSNYTLLSPDPVPTILDPLPVPVDYNTASTPQPYAPAIKILSCDHFASPVPVSYNPANSLVPGHYNQPVVKVPEEQASLSLYSSPSIETVRKPVTDDYNSPPESLPPSTYTVPSQNSDSYYQAAAPVPSPSYLSLSNYTLISPDPVPLLEPVVYNTAPNSQYYAPAVEIPSSDYNPSPVPGHYNPEPLPSPSYPVPSHIPENYNQPVVQVPKAQAPLPLYSSPSIDTASTPATDIYNLPPEPQPPAINTVPSPISDSYYQAPAPVSSPSYLSPSNYTLLSPDPVPTILDPLPVPVDYNTASTPQPYAPAIKILSCDHISSPVPGPYNPEPLHSSLYPAPSLVAGHYNQTVVKVPKEKASLSLYSSPSINSVPTPLTNVYNSPPKPLPPSTYKVPSPISDSYFQAPEPVPSPSYLLSSNYTVLSPDPVPTIVDSLPVPVDYNTAPAPQRYAPAFKILSCDHISSPTPGSYNPEPLHLSSYPAPSSIPGNFNQPVVQVPEEQASLPLYSSPSIDTVPTPVTDDYNSPPESLPPAINTVPSPISDIYYQAPAPVSSPSYLSPSNYTQLSLDPVPTIVDALPVPVDYNTAPTPQPYAPAIKILSCDHIASPVPGSYNPVPSLVPGHYNQPVVKVPEEQAYLSLHSSPSIDTVPTPVTDDYNSPPESLPPATYTVPSPISDSFYQPAAPVTSPSYLSPSNYTFISPDPVPLPVPVVYNTAPNPRYYAPAVEIRSSDYNPSPVPGHYNPEPLPSPSYPVPSHIPENYNQPVVQVPKAQAPLPLYSSPSIDTVSTPATDIYNLPPEPQPPAINTVPSPISDSYYQAPAPVSSPSYLSPSNYTQLSLDPVPTIVDALPVPVDYNTAPTPQPYAPAIKILSCDHFASPVPGSYNPAPSLVPGHYNQPVVKVPEEQASLSLYSSPSIDTVAKPVTDDYNSPPESLPPSTYTVPAQNSDSYYQAAAPVPSPSYLSPSNYTLITPDPVPLPVPVVYNTAPNPQSYAPAVEIPSSDYNLSPVQGLYTREPLPSPSYPVPSPIQGNYNQPVNQVSEVEPSLSLYTSPSYDTVSTHATDIYNLPQEPLPPATYTVPSGTSGSYYQAPVPVPSPSYLSPSNYTVFSPDPVPAIVDPLPVPVDLSTASKPQSYAPAIEIPSCDHNPSPAPGPYNPKSHIAAQELPPSSTYPVTYNEVSASDNVHSPAPYSPSLDPLPLPSYSVPSSNPSDYKELFVAAPVSSYSLPTYNPTSSHVLGNYNSDPQTYYSHNVSSAGTVNYNPDSAAASPVPDPYNPFTEPPAAPSYPSPSPIPLYEPILSDPVPHYLSPLPASTTPPAVNNQYTTSATHTKYSNPSISNPVSNAYALSDSDKIPYKPVPNYKQSSNIYSAPSEQPYNSFSAVTPSPSQTYQQLSNTTYSPPETSNAYAEESSPDVGSCSNVETFSSPVLDYQNIPFYSQIYKGIPLSGKNYSDKLNNNNIVKSHAYPFTSHDKPKVYSEGKIEHSRQSANNEGQTIYNGVVYQGPYYYIPKYKHINYGNFNFLPSQNMSPAPVPFAPAIPALVSAYPYVGTPFSGYSTNPFEQLLKQLQYIATKN